MSSDFQQPDDERQIQREPLVPEIVSSGEYDPFVAGSTPQPEPATYWTGGQVRGGGRVRVFGCTRSCLVVCFVAVLVGILLVNAIF
jgi:hypothetical protein